MKKVVVLGCSGSGKSTLLQLLMGFYEIDGGDIMIGGHSVKTMSMIFFKILIF